MGYSHVDSFSAQRTLGPGDDTGFVDVGSTCLPLALFFAIVVRVYSSGCLVLCLCLFDSFHAHAGTAAARCGS